MSLSFISDKNLKKHIAETIKNYGENLFCLIKIFTAQVGKKLLKVKFFGNVINPITTALDIFTKKFFNISKVALFQSQVGM